MKVFECSKWIWYEKTGRIDDYGEFYGALNYESGRVVCRISVDSDYALYINGKFVTSINTGIFPIIKLTTNLT